MPEALMGVCYTEGDTPKLQVVGMCSNVARLGAVSNVSHRRVISDQILYCPTNALNYINCRVIKNTLKM